MLGHDPRRAALILVDLQNDFLHPRGAYARGGVVSEAARALPERLVPVRDAMRDAGACTLATKFTLVPGRDGEPLISAHLARARPFLGRGDFAPGSFGQSVVEALRPVDFEVEKVAFSAFYMSRLEFVLRRAGVETLVVAGIVTNGGVASTVRDAHVRDFETIVLGDGCAAFRPEVHEAALADLSTIATVTTRAALLASIGA